MNDEIYLIQDSWGFCVLCGENKDLRFGYCFGCCDYAQGEEDLCYFNGLGNFNILRGFCAIYCKFSIKCRVKQNELQ